MTRKNPWASDENREAHRRGCIIAAKRRKARDANLVSARAAVEAGYLGDVGRYDVIEVQIADLSERVMASNLTESDAEATIRLAVARRGVETAFFIARPTSRP